MNKVGTDISTDKVLVPVPVPVEDKKALRVLIRLKVAVVNNGTGYKEGRNARIMNEFL